LRVEELLRDRGLAGFGDSLVNFLYSLAATRKYGRPMGLKVGNRALAEAVRRSKFRELLPRRVDRKTMGDYAEALIAYAWLRRLVTTDSCVEILAENVDSPVDAFTDLLKTVMEALKGHEGEDC